MISILLDCGSLPIPLLVQRIRRICVAGVLGLEPRLTEPESVGLPITLYPMCTRSGLIAPAWRKDKLYCKPSFGPKLHSEERNLFDGGCSVQLDVDAQL